MINKVKYIVIVFLFTLILFPGTALAHDADVSGKVFVKVDGRTIYIPGVVIIREDKNENDNTYGSNKGPVSITNSNGEYKYFYQGVIGATPTSCRTFHENGSRECAGMNIGQNPGEESCGPHYHCGLTCAADAQRWLAYFPKNFNTTVFNGLGIKFVANNMKGGGTWKVGSGGQNSTMRVAPGGKNWVVNAANFGSVTYGGNEWFEAVTSNNSSGLANLNIEWVPNANSLSCTSLTKSVNEIKIGDQTIFTCAHQITGYTFSHYEYRIHTPQNGTDPTAANYWTTPAGWNNLTGATPQYTAGSAGSYAVQCRVCANEDIKTGSKCTEWGQAS